MLCGAEAAASVSSSAALPRRLSAHGSAKFAGNAAGELQLQASAQPRSGASKRSTSAVSTVAVAVAVAAAALAPAGAAHAELMDKALYASIMQACPAVAALARRGLRRASARRVT